MGMRPTGNRSIAVVGANGKAARIQLRMPTLKTADRKSCGPIRSGAACAGCSEPSGSRATRWLVGLKKRLTLPPLSETLVPAESREVLELDELWSFVCQKSQQVWIWIALCRRTRQVVAYAIGDRSKHTCQRLWQAIPEPYRTGVCFTDFWAAYQAIIPDEQHRAVGKETGQTAHVERWNNTLRQRLARFVRLTLSFSKSLFMHEACLRLFLHRYNADCAVLLM